MIKNKEVQSTMMTVAKKSDMTDEYLIETTSNLAQNHHMAEAIEFLALAKDENGKDRFSSSQVSEESKYLFDKTKGFCSTYKKNVVEYAKHLKLSSENVLRVTHNTTEHPEIKPEVNAILNRTNSTGDEVANHSDILASKEKNKPESYNLHNADNKKDKQGYEQLQQESENNTEKSYAYSQEDLYKKLKTKQSNTSNITNQTISNPILLNSCESTDNIVQKAIINGVVYERSTVLRELTKKYGASAEKVLNAIEKDSSFIDLMKQYNGNQTIVNALVDDPYLIQKIKKTSSSLSINELADIIKLCTDSASTEVMLAALQNHNPQEAMMITKKSKIFNLKDDTLEILSKSNTSADNKKNELENLYFTGNKNKEIIG